MAQYLVSTPFLAELYRGPFEIAVILFELAFEPRQQCKGISGLPGKPCQNLIVLKPPHLPGAGFHNRLTHCHLAVAGKCHAGAFPDEQHCSATNPICFFLHVSLNQTIETRFKVSQGRLLECWLSLECANLLAL